MSMVNIFKSKNFFFSISIWIIITVLLIMIIFSISVYYNIENAVVKNEYETNKKILYQMKYNIDYMNEIVRNICISTYYSSDAQYIMFNKDDKEIYEFITKMDRFKLLADSTAFIRSIYIYNNNTQTYYSTYNSIFYKDIMLSELINSYKAIPKMKLIPRKIEAYNTDKKKYEYVFSYFIYDSLDQKNQMDGAVIVNVKSEWLFDNIKMVNAIDKKKQDKIFVVSDTGEFILDSKEDEQFKMDLKKVYTAHLDTIYRSDEEIGYFTRDINKQKYLISYVKLKNADWILLKAQSYDQAYYYINRLKVGIIITTLIFLVFAIIVSLLISGRIYKPIGNLVREVSFEQPKEVNINNQKGEIEFLKEIYKKSASELNLYRKEISSNREIVKTYYLRKLLIDSFSLSENELGEIKEKSNISITLDSPLAVCIIKIDSYKDFSEKLDNRDKELLKFAIINITTEVISSSFKNEAIDMRNDQIVIILNIANDINNHFDVLVQLVKRAQESILEHYKISITASVSERVHNVKEITKCYDSALNNSMYRYIYGKMAVITPELVKENVESLKVGYSSSLEKKLTEEIKYGNTENIEDVLKKIINEISRQNYNNMGLSTMGLVNTISSVIGEINQMRLEPVHIDFNLINRQILECESMDELHTKLMELLKQMAYKEKNVENERHTILVEAVKDIVHSNYFDSGLCLSRIASMLKLSESHIGRIFKTNTRMSVNEYINELRLEKAVKWLENSELNINAVMEKVGIENKSLFFKIFKKKFGTTPKEYVLKKSMQEI